MKKYFTPSPTFLLPPPSIYSEAQSQNTSISTSLLYPNPAQTTLHARLGNNEQIQEVTIYDRVGRILYTQALAFKADSADIDLSAFQSGYYFICITTASSKVFKGAFEVY